VEGVGRGLQVTGLRQGALRDVDAATRKGVNRHLCVEGCVCWTRSFSSLCVCVCVKGDARDMLVVRPAVLDYKKQ